jgi:hypothetical protein
MSRDVLEVIVAGQHGQIETNTEADQEGIDCSDLHARSAAVVSQLSCSDVIVAIGHQHWQRGKAIQDLIEGLRPCEALEELLENEACRDDRLAPLNGLNQSTHFRRG